MAAESDARLARGEGLALDGLPLAVKDLFCTEGVPTTAGSRILEDFEPPYESTVTANLWRAGAVMLGKANMDEFAMGSANVTSAYGNVENPWRRRGDNRPLVPGGSSGGSAAAVAARAALAATGTDTGGSIRQPASFCGIVGLEADLWPLLALGHRRLRLVARPGRADDAHGARRRDHADVDGRARSRRIRPRRRCRCPISKPASGATSAACRIGIPREYRLDGMPAEIEALWQRGVALARGGRAPSPVEISLPLTKYALPAYYIIAPAEASSNLARYDGVRFGLRVAGESLDAMYENTRAAGLRRRGAAAHPDRHLCAVGRLLRRLLPEGAEGAGADRARLRRGVRALRRDPDADRAVGRLRHRREDGRSGRDVSERRLHRAVEPRRAAGDLGAGGLDAPTGCRWACR